MVSIGQSSIGAERVRLAGDGDFESFDLHPLIGQPISQALQVLQKRLFRRAIFDFEFGRHLTSFDPKGHLERP